MKDREKFNPPSNPSGAPYFLFLLIVLACVSRFFLIGRESFWLDEAANIAIAREVGSLHLEHGLFFSSWNDSHPVVYYFLVYLWMKLFGTGEAATRALSAIFGLLLVVCTCHVGRKAISKEAGVIASLLFLVNPVALYYSQETRMYTIIPLLILLSTYYFYELVSHRNKRFFVLYVLFSVLLIYTDYLGTLLLGVHFCFLLLVFSLDVYRKSLLPVFLAYPAILLLYVPWLPNALLRLNWLLIAWMEPPTASNVATVALHLLGVDFVRPAGEVSLSGSLQGILWAVAAAWGALVFLVGLLVSFREARTFKTLLAVLCFMPLVMVFISIIKVPIFNLRQASVYYPMMALTMASGVLAIARSIPERLKKGTLAPAWAWFLIPLLVAGVVSSYRMYTTDTKENWRELAADMEEVEADRPIYVCRWYMIRPFTYYYKGSAEVAGIKEEDLELLGDSTDFEEIVFIVSHIDPSSVIAILEQDFQVQEGLQYRGARVYYLRRYTGDSRPEQVKE